MSQSSKKDAIAITVVVIAFVIIIGLTIYIAVKPVKPVPPPRSSRSSKSRQIGTSTPNMVLQAAKASDPNSFYSIYHSSSQPKIYGLSQNGMSLYVKNNITDSWSNSINIAGPITSITKTWDGKFLATAAFYQPPAGSNGTIPVVNSSVGWILEKDDLELPFWKNYVDGGGNIFSQVYGDVKNKLVLAVSYPWGSNPNFVYTASNLTTPVTWSAVNNTITNSPLSSVYYVSTDSSGNLYTIGNYGTSSSPIIEVVVNSFALTSTGSSVTPTKASTTSPVSMISITPGISNDFYAIGTDGLVYQSSGNNFPQTWTRVGDQTKFLTISVF